MVQYFGLLVLCNVALALYAILNRNKFSGGSPIKFDIGFYIKDSWQENLISLSFTLVVGSIYYFALQPLVASGILSTDFTPFVKDLTLDGLQILMAVFIGLAPKRWFQRLKREGKALVQPTRVSSKGVVYNRKKDQVESIK